MSTVRLLAKLAGVSIATVSRAINGHPSVRPDTREHIMELVQEYHYHPNRLSQSVMSGNSKMFGLLVPNLNDHFYSRIISELLKCAYKEDYQVIILETFSEYKRTIHAISVLIEQRVAGIFACTPCEDIIPMDIIYAIRSHNIKLVSIDSPHFILPIDAVLTDEDNLAMTVVRYLCSLGHKRIGYFGPEIDVKNNNRTNAIYMALKQQGIINNLTNLNAVNDRSFVTEWLKQDKSKRLTAIICWNDYYALMLMQILQRTKIIIPDAISIIGYGNFGFSGLLHPSLTTTEQNPEQMAQMACALMMERISQTTDAPLVAQHLIPAKLIFRESCVSPKT
ncbi:MAG: LacI family DNA-binding transcriptional regulator [bacterium]